MIPVTFLTALALLSGMAAGWWMFGTKEKEDIPEESLESELNCFTRAAERVMMAISQVHDVASRVASDVGTHSSEVGRISSELEQLRDDDPESTTQPTMNVITEMLTVNEKLQGKLAAAEDKLKAQSEEIAEQQPPPQSDSLTGLPNRRAFDAELLARMGDWRASGAPFSLMLVDVDSFKDFNDKHGLPAGDEMLRRVARTLRESMRDQDVACRYAGEEFAILMPGSDIDAAVQAAVRARKAIDALRVPWKNERLHVTVSFGVAEIRSGEEAVDVLRRADDALYAAKGAGRNRGYLHDGDQCLPVADDAAPRSKVATPKANPPRIQQLYDLPNRALLEKELEKRLEDTQKYGLPLSLLTLRVLEFDEVLAELGEQPADQLLDAVVLQLQETIRDIDFLARVAGSRFAIILPGSTEAEAKQVAKRIKTRAAGRTIQLGSTAVSVSLKMELTSYRSGDDLNAFSMRADVDFSKEVSNQGQQPELVS